MGQRAENPGHDQERALADGAKKPAITAAEMFGSVVMFDGVAPSIVPGLPPPPPLPPGMSPPSAASQPTATPAEKADETALRAPQPFVWRDPRTISLMPWVYGKHLLRGCV